MGVMITPIPGPAVVITAGLLHAAGVTVTGVDIDELDTTLTTGPWRGRAGDRGSSSLRRGPLSGVRCQAAPGARWPWPRPPVRRSGLLAS